jgi:outer membrane protein OmpA-like peptidoglycan-associated protein
MRRLILTLPLLALVAGCTTAAERLAAEPTRVVFFEADSTRLDEAAMRVIRDAAALAQRNPGVPVRVLGFAGPTGSSGYNAALSRARAEHVASELAAAGVARDRISIGARGEVPFALIEQESRRVEIRVGG